MRQSQNVAKSVVKLCSMNENLKVCKLKCLKHMLKEPYRRRSIAYTQHEVNNA